MLLEIASRNHGLYLTIAPFWADSETETTPARDEAADTYAWARSRRGPPDDSAGRVARSSRRKGLAVHQLSCNEIGDSLLCFKEGYLESPAVAEG